MLSLASGISSVFAQNEWMYMVSRLVLGMSCRIMAITSVVMGKTQRVTLISHEQVYIPLTLELMALAITDRAVFQTLIFS